jgi:hypothetical protein
MMASLGKMLHLYHREFTSVIFVISATTLLYQILNLIYNNLTFRVFYLFVCVYLCIFDSARIP